MSETLRKSRDSYHCEILLGTPLEYSFCYVVSLVADAVADHVVAAVASESTAKTQE